MQITPIEIRQKRFEKKFRGYNTQEVEVFLQFISHEWGKLIEDYNDLKSVLAHSQKEVSRLQDIEQALLTTMKEAEISARHTIERAEKKAELIIQEAEIKAEKTLQTANTKAQVIEEKGQAAYRQITAQTNNELKTIREKIAERVAYKDHLTHTLQQIAEDIGKEIKRNKNDMPHDKPDEAHDQNETPQKSLVKENTHLLPTDNV